MSILLYDRENIADYENELIDIQLEEGQTATAYEPYNPTETDISFPSPVYGGTLDAVTGVLTVTHGILDLSSLSWSIDSTATNTWFFSTQKSDAKSITKNTTVASIFCPIFKTVNASSIYLDQSGNNAIGQTGRRFRVKATQYNDDVDAFETALTGVLLAYELATPVEIQLTPQQITALVGNNTIWSDADGSMTAVFFKKA